jgi:hypothetical protein
MKNNTNLPKIGSMWVTCKPSTMECIFFQVENYELTATSVWIMGSWKESLNDPGVRVGYSYPHFFEVLQKLYMTIK